MPLTEQYFDELSVNESETYILNFPDIHISLKKLMEKVPGAQSVWGFLKPKILESEERNCI